VLIRLVIGLESSPDTFIQMSATGYVALAALSVYPVKDPIWLIRIAALTA
jgi:hypothetical protein